ncbi:MAG: Tar ligand binding domain-containing protein, partial [Helicobacteraceae bacterium]|nr:Tar ligand binding domain-containing protein [Helicobacteraceae bacterium]
MGFLDRMVLRSKLMLLSGVLIGGLIIVGALGVFGISQWQDDMNSIGDTRLPTLMTLNAINFDRRNAAALAFNVYQYQNWDAVEINKPVGELLKGRQDNFSELDKRWGEFLKITIQEQKSVELKEKVVVSYAKWREASNVVDKAMADVVDNSDATKQKMIFQDYEKAMSQNIASSSEFEKDLAALTERRTVLTLDQIEDARKASNLYTTIIVSVLGGVLAIGILLAVLIVRSISKSITDGVLSISEANSQVLTAADQIAQSTVSLAEGASAQASSVEEVSAT